MEFRYDVPDSFWSLFRSKNRDIYIGALLKINEEYRYNSYFLSREVCISVLSDYLAQESAVLWQDENEDEFESMEPPATRVLNWLLKTKWLKKLEDYYRQVTNIVIPDYAAIFVDAFERLAGDMDEDTQVYIQNIYAILYSFRNHPRANVSMLKSALINTRKLNKSLQDMLHNMDKFFGSLLEKDFYGDLLKEHLDGYVEEIIKKKYHILKTSDNFYLYKNDIKNWLREMQTNTEWLDRLMARDQSDATEEQVLEMLDDIDRGFQDIEHRLNNMDKEHMKYVTATVTRLNYLLNREGDMKGMMIQILNGIAQNDDPEECIKVVSKKMNLSSLDMLTRNSLYRRRKTKKAFTEQLEDEEAREELSKEEVLRLNKIRNRFSKQEIEDFLDDRLNREEGKVHMKDMPIQNEEEFEKLILAYDYAMKRSSRYKVLEPTEEIEMVTKNGFTYPALVFISKEVY